MKPILFNTEMVKAILEGRKNQTRRIVANKILNEIHKNDYYIHNGQIYGTCMCQGDPDGSGGYEVDRWEEIYTQSYSQYKVGDVLWVREPARVKTWCGRTNKIRFWYQASREDEREIDLPQRFEDIFSGGNRTVIPEWITECKGVPNGCIKEMARIFLKVTNVRVERLQDISDEDCIKEGIVEVTKDNQVFKFCIYDKKDYSSIPWQDMPKNPQEVYKKLWNSTTKDGYKWEDNPYVFIYEFERIHDV